MTRSRLAVPEVPLLRREQDPATAIEQGDWGSAVAGLRRLQQQRGLSPVELDLLARAAYGAGEFELAISSWERAHVACQRVGDVDGAAAAAATIAMYLMMDTALMAPVRGWTTRAERLLEGRPEGPTHALLAMGHTYERFLSGDADQARRWSERAVEIGARQGVPLAVALGRTAAARLRILAGDVEVGLDLLDEAAVSVVSGELDPLGAGMVYCELICAMQGLAQYDRAAEWTEAMDRWRTGIAYGGINGRCRVHRAELLRLRGASDEAEDEALHACRELRPWMRREFGWPLTELGTVRLLKGDLTGAEESFLEAYRHGWDPQPGLALLRLAQGDVRTAVVLITDALDHPRSVPSKERPPYGGLRRAPLLAAQVEICLVAGDRETARRASAELSGIATTFHSRGLCAAAALARARTALSDGDADAAVRESEDAVGAWTELGAPHEAGRARLVLAESYLARGCPERAELELQAVDAACPRRPTFVAPAEVPAPRDQLDTDSAPTPENVFRLDGDTRSVAFAGTAVLLHDLKGMRYLARLLAQPGREFHVLDLVGREHGHGAAEPDTDLGPSLDAQAREAYKRRLTEIEADVDEALELGDRARVAQAEADREYLVAELARAFGVGGRHRLVGASSERARASVTRSLRYAVRRIAAHHPPLAQHLERTVRTGTYCSYEPDPRVPATWEL